MSGSDHFIAEGGSDTSQRKTVFENIFESVLIKPRQVSLCTSPFLVALLPLFRHLRRALVVLCLILRTSVRRVSDLK
jgi:hypothetical protein